MKTDRFSDSIRRKLESIRPEFSEKDWVRMQASLQQATPTPSTDSPSAHQPFAGSAWSTQPWLLAAAAVSTAVLISVAVWQRSQINDLRSQLSVKQPTQTVQPTPTPPATESDSPTAAVNGQTPPSVGVSPGQSSQLAGQGEATARRADTVFITRYVTIPEPGSPSQNRAAQRSANGLNDESVGRPDRIQSLASGNDQKRSVTRPTSPVRDIDVSDASPLTEPASERMNEPAESVTRSDRRITTTNQPNDVTAESIRTTNPLATGIATESYSRAATKSRSSRRANEPNTKLSQSSRPDGIAGRGSRSSTTGTYAGSVANSSPADASIRVKGSDGRDAEAGQVTVAYEAVTSRPLTLGTIDWKTQLAYRARRMRPARTTVVGGTPAPAVEATSQPVDQVAIGFRLGGGMEVMSKLISGSALGELLVGKHLLISTGLGLASFAGGKFGSDDEFDKKNNRQNFRRDYVRGIDPRNQLLNIGIHTEIVQVPLNIGYRIPLNQWFSLLPSVGTTLNLQSREHVTFEYRPPFYRSTETVSSQISRPVDLVNSLSLGTGLEWNRKHWVAQAGPVMVLSGKSTVNWQDGASFGLRTRVFYQF